MAQEESGKKTFLKSVLIYVFLFYVGYVVSDLMLLKFVRPLFIAKLNAKDVGQGNIFFEKQTAGLLNSEIGSFRSETDRITSRNIFNSTDMPVALAKLKDTGDSEEEEFEDNEPVLTGLSLTLEGTAVHRNPFRSLATVKGEDRVQTYTVGDEINNVAEVISVLRKKVIFRNLQNKRLEFIEITRNQVKAAKPAPPKKAYVSKPKTTGVVERNGNKFSAKRSDVQRYLSNYRSLLRQANSRPVKDSATGETIGFELFAIQPGSIFEQLGVQNGDVIGEVNGQKITNVGQAMSVFNKLKSASDIQVSITRGGRDMEFEYTID